MYVHVYVRRSRNDGSLRILYPRVLFLPCGGLGVGVHASCVARRSAGVGIACTCVDIFTLSLSPFF